MSAQRLADVDCALIDLGLPDASGLQALQRIRGAGRAALGTLIDPQSPNQKKHKATRR